MKSIVLLIFSVLLSAVAAAQSISLQSGEEVSSTAFRMGWSQENAEKVLFLEVDFVKANDGELRNKSLVELTTKYLLPRATQAKVRTGILQIVSKNSDETLVPFLLEKIDREGSMITFELDDNWRWKQTSGAEVVFPPPDENKGSLDEDSGIFVLNKSKQTLQPGTAAIINLVDIEENSTPARAWDRSWRYYLKISGCNPDVESSWLDDKGIGSIQFQVFPEPPLDHLKVTPKFWFGFKRQAAGWPCDKPAQMDAINNYATWDAVRDP